jgi:RNA polymerase sigma-70 factor (ECF subfamily)
MFFLRRTREADRAADLTAECFARALAGRDRFDPDLGEPRGWLFGIARHLLARSLERGRIEDDVRRQLGMEPLLLDDAALARINALDERPAMSALADLPRDQAQAVSGRVIDEVPYPVLAARLNCSESVLRQRVSRGLRALRDDLRSTL